MTQFGHLFEGFVVGELLAQASWLDSVASFAHWRTRDNTDLDLIIESDDGRVVAFEIKAGTGVAGENVSGLRALREHLGRLSPQEWSCTQGLAATALKTGCI